MNERNPTLITSTSKTTQVDELVEKRRIFRDNLKSFRDNLKKL